MFDVTGTDTGREWIEITNLGEIGIDVSEYKLFEANVNHGLTVVSGDGTLSKNESAVIVSDAEKFGLDWPNFSGIILDSSFSLSNTGEILILKNADLVEEDELSYTADIGALGDGNSLHVTNSGLVAGLPDPGTYDGTIPVGQVLGESTGGSPTASSIVTGLSSHSTPQEVSFAKEIINIALATARDRVTLVGMPMIFEAQALDAKNSSRSIDGAEYTWSLGDGSTQSGKKISYAYLERGTYVVVVKAKFKESIAVSRVEVIVQPFDVSISGVNESEYVEFENQLNSEANIGGASIANDTIAFQIPEDTIILSKKKLRLPKEVLGIDLSVGPIYLKDAQGKIISKFAKPQVGEVLGVSEKVSPLSDSKIESVPLEAKVETKPQIKVIENKVLPKQETAEKVTVKKAFKPIEVISKKKEGRFARILRFFGNLF